MGTDPLASMQKGTQMTPSKVLRKTNPWLFPWSSDSRQQFPQTHRSSSKALILLGCLICGVATVAQAGPPPANILVKVDVDQYGVPYFNSDEVQQIVSKMQSIANDDLGADQLNFVTTGSTPETADRTITLTKNGKGSCYGETGSDAKTTLVVYGGTFMFYSTPTFTGTNLYNAMAETGIHEVAHTYGANDNINASIDIMTTGDPVGNAVRQQDKRHLNSDDVKKIKDNIKKNAAPMNKNQNDIVVYDSGPLPYFHEDTGYINARVQVTGPAAGNFGLGWMVTNVAGNQDVLFTHLPDSSNDMMTLWTGKGIQLAIEGLPGTAYENQIFTLADYGSISGSDSVFNALHNQTVDRNLTISWDINHDGQSDVTASFSTSALDPTTTDGFTVVPEPSSAALLGLCAVTAWLLRLGGIRVTREQ
jgi:hypothetical protein